MNVVVVQGKLTRLPEERVLPSGDRLVAYEVTSRGPDNKAESVPVVWPDPPARALTLPVGEEVVVVGRVRRRFFRAGGSTQSRTEVVADTLVASRAKARAREAVGRAIDALSADGAAAG